MRNRQGISRRELIAGLVAAGALEGCATPGEKSSAKRSSGAADPNFTLIPMNVGECKLGKNHVLGDPYSDDERIDFTIYSFLADGGPGRRVLIDLGPVGLDYLNAMFRRYDFFRDLPGDPDAIRQPYGNVFDWLKRLGLEPSDIDHIVLTHLHADHHGLTDGTDGGAAMRFPRAKLHVSRIGWQANLDRRVDGHWNSYVDYAFSDYLLAEQRRGRVLFHDNDEVLAGMDVIYMGGHSKCSQVVRVRTVEGPAVITGDEIYQYNLLEKGILARLYTKREKLLASNDRLADMALDGAILLPCHDPALWEFYSRSGAAWLREAARASKRAARGFKAAPKKQLRRGAAES